MLHSPLLCEVMNLVIDIGNTRTKYAVFSANKHLVSSDKEEEFTNFQGKYTFSHCIISSVKNHTFNTNINAPIIYFNSNTPIPITNNYGTPLTLGIDRLANAVGGSQLFPDTEVLIIDAGTSLTFDFVSAKNVYCGGSISPGLTMRYKALHTFTEKLPLTPSCKTKKLIGKDTIECINSGVFIGMLKEIDGIIELYKMQYPAIKVVLTGGDSSFFENELKNTIFANSLLTLIGLNTILNYNVS